METHVAMQETHRSDLSLAWSCLRIRKQWKKHCRSFAFKPEVLNTYVTTIAIFLLKSVSEHSALRVSLAPFCDRHYRATGPCLKRRKGTASCTANARSRTGQGAKKSTFIKKKKKNPKSGCALCQRGGTVDGGKPQE